MKNLFRSITSVLLAISLAFPILWAVLPSNRASAENSNPPPAAENIVAGPAVKVTGADHNGNHLADQESDRARASDSPQNISDHVYSGMFKILFNVFALSIVLESALAVLFNWRPFLIYFASKGARTPISLILAWVVSSLLHLDLISQLYAASSESNAVDLHGIGTFLTALVLAGGSSGVNNIMKSLGFRDIARPETISPKPPMNSAWVSVRLNQAQAVGSVRVFLIRGANPAELVGSLEAGRSTPLIFSGC